MRDNKGFTLIEIIIAIAIMITITSIGYVAIRGNIKSSKHQGIVSKGQMSVNLVNQLLTKDLEKSIDVKRILKESSYLYEINTQGQKEDGILIKYVVYEVNLHNDKYDLFRYSYDDKYNLVSKLDIVKNQNLINKSKYPFSINKKESTDIYTIELQYDDGRNDKIYSFEIDSRITYIDENDDDGEDSTLPQIPSEFGDNTYHIGFWTKDASKYEDYNLGTWIEDNHAKGNQSLDDEEFDIKAQLRPGNKGEGENASIDDLIVEGVKESVEIDKISIYISPGTTVKNFKIESDTGSVSISVKGVDINGTLFGGNKGRWYECEIEPVNKKVNKFSITSGILSIDKELVDMGYLWMVYGECK